MRVIAVWFLSDDPCIRNACVHACMRTQRSSAFLAMYALTLGKGVAGRLGSVCVYGDEYDNNFGESPSLGTAWNIPVICDDKVHLSQRVLQLVDYCVGTAIINALVVE